MSARKSSRANPDKETDGFSELPVTTVEGGKRRTSTRSTASGPVLFSAPGGAAPLFAAGESGNESCGSVVMRDGKLFASSVVSPTNQEKRLSAFYTVRKAGLHPVALEHVRVLPRGGHWMKVGDTVMQFGCPAETIKDSMTLGLSVPRFFVVLGELFSRTKGLTFAELEFPCYFNFFIRKERTVVFTTRPIEQRIRAVFQETLLGPLAKDLQPEKDFPAGTPRDHFPNFRGEGEWLDPARKTLTVDTLLEFRIFREDADGSRLLARVDEHCELEYDRNEAMYHVRSDALPAGTSELCIHMEDIISHMESDMILGNRAPCESSLEMNELPVFGVTMLGTSHGFDAKGQTTGFVVWVNRRGVMVDPPPNAVDSLDNLKISASVIDAIILTHCHSDHDAGAFRRLLLDRNITIYTTHTIYESFLRKYSAITGFTAEFLRQLLHVQLIQVGRSVALHGAEFLFRYALHTIPCIGFTVTLAGKTFSYSADTHNSTDLYQRMRADHVIGEGRFESLSNFPWQSDMLLHEAGVPPIHTPMSVLLKLPEDVKQRMYVVHVAEKDVPRDGGLRPLRKGDTVVIDVPKNELGLGQEVLDVLRSIDLFSPLCHSFDNALDLLYRVQLMNFSPGSLIVKAGDPGDRLFLIIKGAAEVNWNVGEKKYSKFFRVGDYFGETSLVTGDPRNADVFAVGHVCAATISSSNFDALIEGTQIRRNLLKLIDTRKKDSWQLFESNSVLRSFSSTAKTDLEVHMQKRDFERGEIAWRAGDPAQMVMLIKSGSFLCKTNMAALRDRKMNLRFSAASGEDDERLHATGAPGSPPGIDWRRAGPAGSLSVLNEDAVIGGARDMDGIALPSTLVGDFDAVFGNGTVASTVFCLESGTALIIPCDMWRQFCLKFPGGLIFFMGKMMAT